jgi:hypothetical protein
MTEHTNSSALPATHFDHTPEDKIHLSIVFYNWPRRGDRRSTRHRRWPLDVASLEVHAKFGGFVICSQLDEVGQHGSVESGLEIKWF